MNFLFCIIGFKSYEEYLPHTWGSIRQYCEFIDERDFSKVNFMDPIFDSMVMPDDYKIITDRYDFKDIDILMFSNYVWNWKTHINIANHARKENPNIVIIGGGPSTLVKDWQDTYLFESFDYVTSTEAEYLSAEVFHRLLNNQSLDDIEQLIDPRNPVDVPPKRYDLSKMKHPYKTYSDDYIRFADDIRKKGKMVSCVLETNRGCPYKCAFCDWGQTTNSKLKRFDQEEILEEIEFICKYIKPNFLFNVDANVGILDFDVKVTEKVIQCKKEYGYPHSYYWSPAKNNRERVGKISKLLYENGLNAANQIAFQHFDNEVLTVMERDNISIDIYKQTMMDSYRLKVPIEGTIILGNPGDTIEKWNDTLETSIRMNFADFKIHEYLVLPNAPAGHPDYMNKYKIKTMNKYFTDSQNGFLDLSKGYFEVDYACESYSYTKEDYVLFLYNKTIVETFVQLNFAKFINAFVYHKMDTNNLDFLFKVCELPSVKPFLIELKKNIESYVLGNRPYNFIEIEYEDIKKEISPEYWLYYKLLEIQDVVYSEVSEMLIKDFKIDADIVNDIINYQMLSMTTNIKDKEFEFIYNIKEFMYKIITSAPMERLTDFKIVKLEEKLNEVIVKDFASYVECLISSRKTSHRKSDGYLKLGLFGDKRL